MLAYTHPNAAVTSPVIAPDRVRMRTAPGADHVLLTCVFCPVLSNRGSRVSGPWVIVRSFTVPVWIRGHKRLFGFSFTCASAQNSVSVPDEIIALATQEGYAQISSIQLKHRQA